MKKALFVWLSSTLWLAWQYLRDVAYAARALPELRWNRFLWCVREIPFPAREAKWPLYVAFGGFALGGILAFAAIRRGKRKDKEP